MNKRGKIYCKKIHQIFLSIKRGLAGFFFAKDIIDDEELGLTF
jgi:hypothetical protein